MISQPISVYVNWASYDELSDTLELTETIALRQLDEILRLRMLGVKFDYYLMDAFWYAPDGGYRAWRSPHFPNGAAPWLEKCLQNGIKPGLWIATNALTKLNCIPEWRESLDPTRAWNGALCCFYGGFLPHLMETLHQWYERGVRLFKFDFADFDAAPPKLQRTLTPREIREANIIAFQGALKAFRMEHPDVVLLAYNGFEDRSIQTQTDLPLYKAIDHRWLDVFDSLYCGDPRPSDVPTMNFWRSKDIYSDHMTRVYEFNDLPLTRIDNAGFMIGTTGTCYYRGTAAWKPMLILSLARGGFVNTYYGNLDLLDAEKGSWFAQVQKLYYDLNRRATTFTFGGLPGSAEPYGFGSMESTSGLITVVNPSQRTVILKLPVNGNLRVVFYDSGFVPILDGNELMLGAEQMAVVGVGSYSNIRLGVEADVQIPREIQPVALTIQSQDEHVILATAAPISEGRLRIIMRQTDKNGRAKRSTGGSPPDGITLGNLLKIEAFQGEHELPVEIQYDKAIWSGLSWAVGEVDAGLMQPHTPITICAVTTEREPLRLELSAYHTLV